MKSDLDALMKARNIDALLVTGPAQHNPPMYYFTGGAHLTHAELLLRRGNGTVLCYRTMEREEAANTGLTTFNLDKYPLNEILKETQGDIVRAHVIRYQKLFAELGFSGGRLAIAGRIDAGRSYALFAALQQSMPGLEVVGELDDSLLLEAMATKDPQEVARIRQMGEVTTGVVGQVAEYLSSQRVKDGVLVNTDGQPVTVGEVKRLINLWLAERGAENPEGTIFAPGREAGIPHSTGTNSHPLRLGQTIIFDIFPCEAGGGYFYDFTRTWCLGYAPDAVQALYEDVKAVYAQIMGELQAGGLCPDYQIRTCELFEARGHPTIHSDVHTEQGYVHSLGHGVGLNIHERPWFGRYTGNADRLAPGSVVTIEPGLYYPERGMGVRLEDTVYVSPDGGMEVLAPYPLDLVLPVKER